MLSLIILIVSSILTFTIILISSFNPEELNAGKDVLMIISYIMSFAIPSTFLFFVMHLK
jgi:hypothetical protein